MDPDRICRYRNVRMADARATVRSVYSRESIRAGLFPATLLRHRRRPDTCRRASRRGTHKGIRAHRQSALRRSGSRGRRAPVAVATENRTSSMGQPHGAVAARCSCGSGQPAVQAPFEGVSFGRRYRGLQCSWAAPSMAKTYQPSVRTRPPLQGARLVRSGCL